MLNFGPSTPGAAFPLDLRIWHVVDDPTGRCDIADTEGHLAKAYGATDHTLVLIRPDGYVALISDSGRTSAVSDYVAALG